MSGGKPTPRILHLHSSFDRGGKELRCVRLINALGSGIEHHIVSADEEALGASDLIFDTIPVDYPIDFPSLRGWPTLWRLKRIADAMKGFDLILTYNWGAMDAVMAHTLFAATLDLSPLIHHEDGFNEDEALRLKPQRNWFRRIALGRTAALVVPSKRLEEIAHEAWHQPASRIHRIANGVATAAYRKKPARDVLPRLIKHEGEFWVGTLAGLRSVKNLPRLVRAFAVLPKEWQLVIFGDGPEKDAILSEARGLAIEHRVHLPGFVSDPSEVIGLFDIFALSSDSEQFPISLVEAMAAGLPIAAPDVGDVREMVSSENLKYIVAPGDDFALAGALATLAEDAEERRICGDANRTKAREAFDEKRMIARYKALYFAAMAGKPLR